VSERVSTHGCIIACSSHARCMPPVLTCASFMASPCTPDRPTRSDPARSIRCSFPMVSFPVSELRAITYTLRMRCERDDTSFMFVAVTLRFLLPRFNVSNTSFSLATDTILQSEHGGKQHEQTVSALNMRIAHLYPHSPHVSFCSPAATDVRSCTSIPYCP
jgi:hypothetical protein